jgi:hypothetical protein
MKKWLLGLFLVVCFPAYAEQYPIADFHCGLNSNYSPLTIQDCEVQDTLNTLFDEDNAAVKRKGYDVSASTDNTKFYGGWAYTDATGNAWRIYLRDSSIVGTKGDGTFAVKIATYTAGSTVNAVTAFNKIWFVDQIQGVYSWDGTTMLNIAGSPKGKYIAAYKNRLVVSGLVSPNQSQIYISKYLDGTTWTTGSLATDPVILTAGLQDASDIVTAFYAGFNDILLIFKKQSIYALFGTDQTDFSMKVLNTEVGCIDQRSIQPYQNGLVFASGRAIEYYNGVTVTPISDKIKNYTDSILNSAYGFATWGETNSIDFSAGTIQPANQLSINIDPGNIVTSTYSKVQTLSADFTGGTLSTSIVTNDKIEFAGPIVGYTSTVDNWSFETGDLSNWDSVGGTWSIGSSAITGKLGTYYVDYSTSSTKISATVQIIDSNGTILVDKTPFSCSPDCTHFYEDVDCYSQFMNKRVKFRLNVITNTGVASLTTSRYYTFGSYIAAGQNACLSFKSIGIPVTYFDGLGFYFNPINLLSTGTYTSEIFDTSFSSSYLKANVNWTVDYSTPQFAVKTSTSVTGTWSTILTSTNTDAIAQQYVLYITTVNNASSVNDVTLFARSSGTYYSQVYNSPTLSRWENFNASYQNNSGSSLFYVRASTMPFTVLSSTPAWIAQTVNFSMATSTVGYFQMKNDLGITSSTCTPLTSDFSFNGYLGSQPPPMASAIFNQRYYLASSTAPSLGYNNIVFVLGKDFSKGPVWSLWDLKAGGLVTLNGKMYHVSGDNLGKEYQDFIGYTDAGNIITAFIRTKDYALGDFTIDKYFNSLFLYAENMGHFTLDTSYYINKTSTGYNLDQVYQDESGGILNLRLPFPYSNNTPRFGKTISFKFINSAANEQIKLLGGVLDYTPAKHIR